MSRTSVARARADTHEPGYAAALAASRCRGSGLDPAAYAGLVGAALTLGHPLLDAGAAWRTDRELVDAVAALADEIGARQARLRALRADVQADLDRAQRQAAAEMRMSGRVGAATAATLADCRTALEVIDEAAPRLAHAASRVAAVPEALGDTYRAAYRLVRRGGVLPRDGRWLTGEGEG